jgi:hypothetical protein
MKLTLVSACAALALVTGCGSGSLPPQQIPGVSEQLLTAAAVGRYPAGSPQHALLDWWRSAQFADRPAFLAAFTPPLRSRLQRSRTFGEDLDFFAGSIRNAAPRILSTETEGDRARIFTKIEFRNPVGATRFVASSRPQAFELVRRGSDWLLADDTFLRSTLRLRAP